MSSAKTQTLFRTAGIVSLLLVVSRLMGFVREMLLADRFGRTSVIDAYVTALDIPNALFSAISASLIMVFIPVYREVIQKQGDRSGDGLAHTVLNATVLLASLLVGVGWLAAPIIVPALVPGMESGSQQMTIALTRTLMPMMLFLGISGVMAAVLNANRRFTGPALIGMVSNLAVVVGIWLVRSPEQIHWVSWAVIIGAAGGALIQIPWLLKLGIGYRPVLQWRHPAFQQMGYLILPVLVTTLATQAQNFVDRYLASGLVEGSIAALNYAVRVNSLPYGVIGAAISTVLYPSLAEHAAAGHTTELRRTVINGLRTLSFVLLPMALGVIFFREPITRLVYQRGEFGPQDTAAVAWALLFYGIGILFFGWLDFMNRSFFALQDTRTPMWIAVLMVLLNIGFSLSLVGPLAHGGLALGTSLSAAAAVGLLLWRIRLRLGGLEVYALAKSLATSLITSGVGVLAGWGLYHLVGRFAPGPSMIHQTLRLTAGLGTVVVLHVVLSILLGNREGADLAARLAPKLRRGKS